MALASNDVDLTKEVLTCCLFEKNVEDDFDGLEVVPLTSVVKDRFLFAIDRSVENGKFLEEQPLEFIHSVYFEGLNCSLDVLL